MRKSNRNTVLDENKEGLQFHPEPDRLLRKVRKQTTAGESQPQEVKKSDDADIFKEGSAAGNTHLRMSTSNSEMTMGGGGADGSTELRDSLQLSPISTRMSTDNLAVSTALAVRAGGRALRARRQSAMFPSDMLSSADAETGVENFRMTAMRNSLRQAMETLQEGQVEKLSRDFNLSMAAYEESEQDNERLRQQNDDLVQRWGEIQTQMVRSERNMEAARFETELRMKRIEKEKNDAVFRAKFNNRLYLFMSIVLNCVLFLGLGYFYFQAIVLPWLYPATPTRCASNFLLQQCPNISTNGTQMAALNITQCEALLQATGGKTGSMAHGMLQGNVPAQARQDCPAVQVVQTKCPDCPKAELPVCPKAECPKVECAVCPACQQANATVVEETHTYTALECQKMCNKDCSNFCNKQITKMDNSNKEILHEAALSFDDLVASVRRHQSIILRRANRLSLLAVTETKKVPSDFLMEMQKMSTSTMRFLSDSGNSESPVHASQTVAETPTASDTVPAQVAEASSKAETDASANKESVPETVQDTQASSNKESVPETAQKEDPQTPNAVAQESTLFMWATLQTVWNILGLFFAIIVLLCGVCSLHNNRRKRVSTEAESEEITSYSRNSTLHATNTSVVLRATTPRRRDIFADTPAHLRRASGRFNLEPLFEVARQAVSVSSRSYLRNAPVDVMQWYADYKLAHDGKVEAYFQQHGLATEVEVKYARGVDAFIFAYHWIWKQRIEHFEINGNDNFPSKNQVRCEELDMDVDLSDMAYSLNQVITNHCSDHNDLVDMIPE